MRQPCGERKGVQPPSSSYRAEDHVSRETSRCARSHGFTGLPESRLQHDCPHIDSIAEREAAPRPRYSPVSWAAGCRRAQHCCGHSARPALRRIAPVMGSAFAHSEHHDPKESEGPPQGVTSRSGDTEAWPAGRMRGIAASGVASRLALCVDRAAPPVPARRVARVRARGDVNPRDIRHATGRT